MWVFQSFSRSVPCADRRQAGKRFFDITDTPNLGSLRANKVQKVVFPEKPGQQDAVNPLLKELSKKEMEDHLTIFSSFHTRYYKVCPTNDTSTRHLP